MGTLREPEFDPVEAPSPSADAFYHSLVVEPGSRQTFTVVIEDLALDDAKVAEIEGAIQDVVAGALAQCALDVKPLEEQASVVGGGGLAGRHFVPKGGLISELLPKD